MTHRRYEVSGTDEHGDGHSFHTDDRGAADEMMGTMSEDLENVRLVEHPPAQKQE